MRFYKILLLAALPALFALNIYAQKDTSKEIKKIDSVRVYTSPTISVTSTRAVERLSPIPFSEINRKEIEPFVSSLDLPMLLNSQPSIVSYSENGNGVGYSNLTLRGFDQRRIAVLVNGIPQNDPEDHNVYWINYSDIIESAESIQIQRGAGLVNYGAAAIGGSINITTTNIFNESGIKLYSGAGFQQFGENNNEMSHNISRYKLEYSSGLVDNKYGFYAKLGSIRSFGYRDQSFANLNNFFISAIRYDEKLSTQINVYGASQRDGLAYNGIPKSHVGDVNLRRRNYTYWEYDRNDGETFSWGANRINAEVEEFSSPHFELLNDYQLTDNISLKSSLFYFTGKGFFDYSGEGWTDANSFRLNQRNGFENAEDPRNPIVRSWVGNSQGGWIPRVVWDHENGVFSAGAEIRIHRSEHWGKLKFAENLPEGFDPEFNFYSYDGKRNIYSAFVRETYNVNEKLTINIEGQLAVQRYAIANEKDGTNFVEYQTQNGTIGQNGGEIFDINYVFFNPRVGANYNFDDNNNIWGLIALTSREPRMANLYRASQSWTGAVPLFQFDTANGNRIYDFNQPLLRPEQMLDIEFGYGYRNNFFRFDANVYWMEYTDELVRSGQLDLFGAPIDGNAPKTRHYGLELDFAATALTTKYGSLAVLGNATISSNKIIEYDFLTRQGEAITLAGNDIAGFSPFIGSASIRFMNEDFFADLSCKYVGGMRTDNFGDLLIEDPRLKAHLRSEFYNDNKLDSYFVINANFNYKIAEFMGARSLRAHLQLNNLTNELYAAWGAGREFFVAAERSIFIGFELEL